LLLSPEKRCSRTGTKNELPWKCHCVLKYKCNGCNLIITAKPSQSQKYIRAPLILE